VPGLADVVASVRGSMVGVLLIKILEYIEPLQLITFRASSSSWPRPPHWKVGLGRLQKEWLPVMIFSRHVSAAKSASIAETSPDLRDPTIRCIAPESVADHVRDADRSCGTHTRHWHGQSSCELWLCHHPVRVPLGRRATGWRNRAQ
jgi:hypothetical protein